MNARFQFALLGIVAAGAPAPVTAQCVESKLHPHDAHAAQHFGSTVSVDGDVAVVGAYGDDERGWAAGAAYVFRRGASGWTQEVELIGSDVAAGDWFGSHVSVSGDRILVGARNDDDKGLDAGAAYVFHWTGAAWVEEAKLTASDGSALDDFAVGRVVGDTAMVGAWGKDDVGQASGAVYVFEFDGAAWYETQKLVASDAASLDRFGSSLWFEDGMALIAAPSDDTPAGKDAGSTYVFERFGSQWIETGRLHASDAAPDARFGHPCVSGSTALIGAPGLLYDPGAAYVFEHGPGGWTEQAKLVVDPPMAQGFGGPLAIQGDVAAVGAPLDGEAADEAGAVFVFERDGGAWSLAAKLTAGLAAQAYDQLGAVALSGDTLLVGQHKGDDYGPDSGGVYAYSVGELACAALFGEPTAIPTTVGGAQVLALNAGPALAGRLFLLLGSFSGTQPGVPIDGHVLPLQVDDYLLHTLAHPNALPLVGGLATLDAEGRAVARFLVPPGLDPALVGDTVHHAYVVFDAGPSVVFVSNAESLLLQP